MSSWVEELKPEDEVIVEIIYPPEYVEYNLATTKKFSAAVAYYCKAAALLGEDETEFLISGMTVLQVYTIEEAMRKFGIEMDHEIIRLDDMNHVHFYADVRGLQKKLEEGDLE